MANTAPLFVESVASLVVAVLIKTAPAQRDPKFGLSPPKVLLKSLLFLFPVIYLNLSVGVMGQPSNGFSSLEQFVFRPPFVT